MGAGKTRLPGMRQPDRRKGSFAVATYNVHQWVGGDGRLDADRIVRVIKGFQAEVVALQESCFYARREEGVTLEGLKEETGLEVIAGPTLCRRGGHFGNVLLTRHPVLELDRFDLSFEACEPRGFIDAVLDVRGFPLRVIATHLGLKRRERREQMGTLLEQVVRRHPGPLVILGDLNEWNPFCRSLRRLGTDCLGRRSPLTFPARLPLLALDRILAHPPEMVAALRVVKNSVTRLASDHLPLIATLHFSPAVPAGESEDFRGSTNPYYRGGSRTAPMEVMESP